MKEIRITKGQIVQVSDDKYDELTRHKWCAQWNKCTKSYYAARRGRDANGKMTGIMMHRQILGLASGDKRLCDHADGNSLNNVNENLRIATRAQNSQNQGRKSSNTSGYKGVHRNSNPGSDDWRAYIRHNGKSIHLGRRPTAEAAYRELYVPAALLYHGEFARLQ